MTPGSPLITKDLEKKEGMDWKECTNLLNALKKLIL